MSDIPYLYRSGEAVFKDMYVTKFSDVIKKWGFDSIDGYGILGVPISKTSISHSGACFAPTSIRKAMSYYSTYCIEDDIDLDSVPIYDLGDIQIHPTDVNISNQRVEDVVHKVFNENSNLKAIILGGDHSISAPCISAMKKNKGKIGVIQFDAHMDIRNLEDGGRTNGTPFRTLIEAGVVEGRNIVQIGIRSFANSKHYANYANEQGIHIYKMSCIDKYNIEQVIISSIEKIEKNIDAIYISVDMDILDQAFAPGCPAIGPGGMDTNTLIKAISLLANYNKVIGMDIVEIDPTLDFRDITSRIAARLILEFIKKNSKIS